MKLLSRERLPILISILFGIVISALPHFLMFFKNGSLVWLADTDELALYLKTASQAYFNHPFFFTDPIFIKPEPTMYPWIQLFPGTILAKIFGLGPLGISLIWRILAGASIGLGWYVLFRHYIGRSWVACLLAIFLLSDSGLIDGKIFFKQIKQVLHITLFNDYSGLQGKPDLHPEWRIITPGLSLIFLQCYILALARVRDVVTRGRILTAGICFGLLFYDYFYYWTAAGVGLLISMLFDRKHLKTYLFTGSIGLMVALPKLVQDFLIKSDRSQDWLQRSDKFVPIPHFSELIVPKVGPFFLLLMMIWIWKRKKSELWFLCAHVLAGLLLLNHQIFTGLQIENFHWNYFWAPILCFLVLLLLAEQCLLAKISKKVLVSVVALVICIHVSAGLWMRGEEALHSTLSQFLLEQLGRYSGQQVQREGSPLKGNSVVAGEQNFLNFSSVLENQRALVSYSAVLSPNLDNREWNRRIALNAILKGQSLKIFSDEQRTVLEREVWGPWARDLSIRKQFLEDRLSAYVMVKDNLDKALIEYNVTYVALDVQAQTPAYLSQGWILRQRGHYWQIWERVGP